jgi:hypothetical protein
VFWRRNEKNGVGEEEREKRERREERVKCRRDRRGIKKGRKQQAPEADLLFGGVGWRELGATPNHEQLGMGLDWAALDLRRERETGNWLLARPRCSAMGTMGWDGGVRS